MLPSSTTTGTWFATGTFGAPIGAGAASLGLGDELSRPIDTTTAGYRETLSCRGVVGLKEVNDIVDQGLRQILE